MWASPRRQHEGRGRPPGPPVLLCRACTGGGGRSGAATQPSRTADQLRGASPRGGRRQNPALRWMVLASFRAFRGDADLLRSGSWGAGEGALPREAECAPSSLPASLCLALSSKPHRVRATPSTARSRRDNAPSALGGPQPRGPTGVHVALSHSNEGDDAVTGRSEPCPLLRPTTNAFPVLPPACQAAHEPRQQ